ncbi:MAG TPA: outer membrane beta-barrel protein [archaeon]|nr:outer membrane beta-barrel protein [archaeon]
MRSVTGFLLLLLLIPGLALARLETGAGLSLAWPHGEFKEHVDFAWGGGVRVGWEFGEQAAAGVSLFADLNYLNYGRERRVEPFSLTIPDVVVNVITDNYMMMVSPGVSFGLRRGVVRPYGELFGGLTYIATKTKIENRGLPSEPIAESTNFSDFTYNFGFGGGVKILVWHKNIEGRQAELREALIDIKFDYVMGGEAEYLKKGSISRDLGYISYDTILSKTGLFQLRIGMSFGF